MIKIGFTGDIMLGRRVGDQLRKNFNHQIISEEVTLMLKDFDFVVGNLECPVTDNSLPMYKTGLQALPQALEQIEVFDLLTLANNHIFDCGKSGAFETIEHLKKRNFFYCGLKTSSQSSIIYITEIKGKRIGFISCAVSSCIREAEGLNPQVISAESGEINEVIRAHHDKLDFIFVLIHGGNEMIPFPEPEFRKLCRNFIDSGASCVISHHPHVLGGHEVYKGKSIFYSLGDFIFDGESYLRRQGAILSLTLKDKDIQWSILPTQINDSLEVSMADVESKNIIIERWNKVSERLLNDAYERNYRKVYMQYLFKFQVDRLLFLTRKKGLKYTLSFVLGKLVFLKFYFNKIYSRK